MAKLNQIVAVVNGIKSRSHTAITELHKKNQKDVLFQGISRTYQPLNDDDIETFAPEKKNVQVKVEEVLAESEKIWSELLDIVFTQDSANCSAKADIKIDGYSIALNVPVTHLLFLEKQLNDIHTFVKEIPELDSATSWKWDEKNNCYRSDETITNKTKKIMRAFEKSPATDKHPAQVETYNEDVKVGEWTKTDFSGAIPPSKKLDLLSKVEKLQEAVKFAREEANGIEVKNEKIAKNLFDFILGRGGK